MSEADQVNLFVDAVGRDRFSADFDAAGWTLDEAYAELCRVTYLAENPQVADNPKETPKVTVDEPAKAAVGAQVEPEVEPEVANMAASASSTQDTDTEIVTESISPTGEADAVDGTMAEVVEQSNVVTAKGEPAAEPAADLDAEPATELWTAGAAEIEADQAKPTRSSARPVRPKKGRSKKKPTGPPPRLPHETRALPSNPAPASQPAAAPASSTTRLPIKPPGWRPAILGAINGTPVAARLMPLCAESLISARVVERAGLTIDTSVTMPFQSADIPHARTLGVVYVFFDVGRHRIPLKMHVVDSMFWDLLYGRDGIAAFQIINGQFKLRVVTMHGDSNVVVHRRKEIPKAMFDR
ncbi:hypothetical protein H9P43_001524 [Blastocladiella emersonii ATCC 22665]|nr:hypothetical protein H9P43_001524 [Blastocladiella emersonii ATCC 22665]